MLGNICFPFRKNRVSKKTYLNKDFNIFWTSMINGKIDHADDNRDNYRYDDDSRWIQIYIYNNYKEYMENIPLLIEKFDTKKDLPAIGLICMGCLLTVLFANTTEKEYTYDELV